ncbi:MAG: response regulator [Gammaproteobacteria bacterium]|nr:response regulator [Gammaproteobacteria bacterium]
MDHSPAKVLVVDDEANNIELLTRRLERYDYTVESARSGPEALERLRATAYDVALLDVMMPGMDGLDVLRTLRGQRVNANTPVIMVTARTSSEDIAAAFDSGADDFITKPVDFRVLLARLKSQIARHQAQRHLEALNQRLNETVEARTRHLRDMESQLTNVAENLPAVLWRIEADEDGDLRLMFLHGAVAHVLGDNQPPLGASLRHLLELFHPDDLEALSDAIAELVAGRKPLALDARLLVEGRSPHWVHLAARPSGNEARRFDGILLDVHDRKNLETQLLHTQKLESVGQLASGIAHEINSPAQYTRDNVAFVKESLDGLLAVVQAQGEALRQAGQGPLPADVLRELADLTERADLDFLRDEVPAALEQSLDGIDRISRIVNAMKGFTHPGGDDPETCDLNKLICDTVTIARNEWKYVANLDLDLDTAMPMVSCHSGELGQVILNLIVNAAHAIADSRNDGLGHIVLSSRYDAELSRVEIRVSDNGPGVPEALRSRIFDPFFTTKAVGKGTGQGLAIAISVIKDKHKGTLTLDDTVTQGASFVISIPA